MKTVVRYILTLAICQILAACSPKVQNPPNTVEPSNNPQATVAGPLATTIQAGTQEAVSFPLSEPGPYWAGYRDYTLIDEDRDGRVIQLRIWYPALEETDAEGETITLNATPDMSGAPYPLILTGANTGLLLLRSHLSSYGFVMAIVQYPDYIAATWGFEMIDHPRDILFALDQIASHPPEGLEGIIDTDHVGVTGYSSDGSYSLTVSGARVDPEYYLSQCEQTATMDPRFAQWFCSLAGDWEAYASHAGSETTVSDDGLWQPMTDERIRAVMPMAPNGAWLYGERGLASVEIPVFIINATKDEFVPYQVEAAYIYEHLGTPERYLVSFIGKSHMMVENDVQAARIKHFVVAFFGYYLLGREEYAYFFSEDFVSQFDDLFWGVYSDD